MKALFASSAKSSHKPVSFEEASVVLLIDAANFAARALHAYSSLSSNSVMTGHVFGVYRMLASIWQKFSARSHSTAIVFALEGHPARRYELIPEYKANRARVEAEDSPLFSTRDLQMQALSLLPVTFSVCPSGEADDVIGILSQRAADRRHRQRVLVFSTDRDLWQLIPDVEIVFKDKKTVTSDLVRRKMGCNPKQVPLMKSLMGDSSDCVPKVPRLGKRFLAQWSDSWLTPDDLLSAKIDDQSMGLIRDHFDQITRAYEAVCLYRKGTLLTEMMPGDQSAFLSLCAEYQMRSIPPLFSSWFS